MTTDIDTIGGDDLPMTTVADLGMTPSEMAALMPVIASASADGDALTIPELLEEGWGTSAREVTGIALAATPQRVRWAPGSTSGSGDQPTCRSHDGRTGRGDYTDGADRECSGCPAAAWPEDGGRPECQERLAFLLLADAGPDDDEPDLPAVVSVPPTSIRAARQTSAAIAAAAARGRGGWYATRVAVSRGTPVTVGVGRVAPVVIRRTGRASDEHAAVARTVGGPAVAAFLARGEVVAESPRGDVGPTEV